MSAALALLLALSPAGQVFADDEQPSDEASSAASEEQVYEESPEDPQPQEDEAQAPLTLTAIRRSVEAAVEKSEEEQFLDKYPELREVGDYVFEGDTVPCSENDPSYHKYIQGMMEALEGGNELGGQLTSMAGIRLLTSAVDGADKLVHQARFKDLPKTYGADVSYFQGAIDWEKVKASGISFAILRAGYRGYGKAGTLVLDDRFLEYLAGAKKAGLEVGVYFYTQAITVAEAREEADFVYKYIKNYKLELPVYSDMETVTGAVGRLDSAGLTRAQKTDIIEAFCERIKSYGYTAGVYSNPQWLTYYLDAARLQAKYPLWLANYTTETKYAGNFEIWQYGYGYVNGVTNIYTDLNVRYHFVTTPDAPTDFKASSITNKATLTWKAVSDCDGYEVFMRTPGGITTSVTKVTSPTASVSLSNVRCTYYVKAYNTSQNTTVYSEPSAEISLASYSPLALRVTSRTDSTLTVSWDKIGVSANYELYKAENGSTTYTKVGSTTGSSLTVTGLKPATVYKFKVRAMTKSGTSYSVARPYTNEYTFGTMGEKITNLKFVTKDANSITFQWKKTSSNCVGYQILKYNASTGKYAAAGTTNQTSYTLTGLSQGTAYKLQVRSYYKNGSETIYGIASNELNCATKCAAPTGCKVTAATDSSYTLSWNAPYGATGYMIYAAAYGSKPVKLAETSDTTYTVTGLDKGVYSVYIRPYIKCGNTRYYGISSSYLYPVCGAKAAALSSSAVTDASVALSWNIPEFTQSTEVYYYNTTSKAWVRKVTLGPAGKSYTVTGMEPSTSYQFKVKTIFKGGSSLYSNVVTAKTLQADKPLTAPTGIKATTATNSTVTIIWNKVDSAVKYKLYILNETTGKYTLRGYTTGTKFTFSGLKQGKLYSMRVYSVSGTGSMKASATYQITPKPVAPKLTVSSKTETTVTLKWSPAALCSKYYIYKLDPLNNEYVKIATTSSTSYTVKGLYKGSRNIFKIKAVAVTNAANFNSLFSSQLSVLTNGVSYYKACSSSCQTLYQGFVQSGITLSYAMQEKIAIANAIAGYEGTAAQNTSMLQTLKNGNLIVAQF